jgi:hypothetical protein
LQVLDVDVPGASVGLQRDRRGKSCRLTHAHRLAHATAARVRVVSRAEATADYPQLFAALWHECSVRHAVSASLLIDVAPDSFFLSCGVLAVVLDGRTAQGDLVVELPAAQAVLLGQSVLTIDAPRLAHADVMREANDLRPPVAGHHVAQEVLVDEGLPPALDFGGGELLRVRRIGVANAHGDGGDAALLNHRVGATLLARQGVADQTADRVLSQLADEGYVVRRAQSGTFLPDVGSVLTRPQLVFHVRGKRVGSFGGRLLQHLQRALTGMGFGRVSVFWIEADKVDAIDPPHEVLPIVWDCPRLAHAWAAAGYRVVLVNDRPDPGVGTAAAQNICSVAIDDLVGGAMAADLLLRCAKFNPPSAWGVLAGPRNDRRSVERVDGFSSRLSRIGLNVGDLPIVWSDGWCRTDGEVAAQRLLESKPNGVFCGNDRLAESFLAACQAAGQEAPLVIGFDDAPITTLLQLSTVAIPWEAIAKGVREVVTRQLSRDTHSVSNWDATCVRYLPAPVLRAL